jgi:hypothetical protein
LLTNSKTTQCGIYEITKKQISYDLGYSIDTVSILLNFFVKAKKIKFSEATNEVAIKNWLKYNSSASPKTQSCVNKELKLIKDTVLIQYIYSIDTTSLKEEEEEEEEEEEKKKKGKPEIPVFNFINSLIDLGVEKQIVSDWIKVRKLKKGSNTETAFKSIKKNIEQSGISANECVKMAVEKNWCGFESEWVKNNLRNETGRNANSDSTARKERLAAEFASVVAKSN